jgi:ATP-dependent Clp protease, protease subunit
MYMPRLKNGGDLISSLFEKRIVMIHDEVNWDMALRVNAQLLLLAEQSDEDIFVYINSPGGCVHSGLAIFDTLNYIKPRVHRVGMGMCASMGAFLLCTGDKGLRYSLPSNQIMIHQVSAGTRGHVNDMKITVAHSDLLNDILFKHMADKMGKSKEELKEWAERDRWLQPTDALEMGVIDRIITSVEEV